MSFKSATYTMVNMQLIANNRDELLTCRLRMSKWQIASI